MPHYAPAATLLDYMCGALGDPRVRQRTGAVSALLNALAALCAAAPPRGPVAEHIRAGAGLALLDAIVDVATHTALPAHVTPHLLPYPSDMKLREGRFEAACNPIGQARFLAEEQVDFIVVIGLCVGHDSLFYKYAAKYTDAFVTTLVSKDRATGNNPCAAIYCADGYFKDKFGDK